MPRKPENKELLKQIGFTVISNAIFYGEFPVTIRRRGKTVTRPLSAGARITYLAMRSLDWKKSGHIWHTWHTIGALIGIERRTLAEHLQELEAAGLIERSERLPGQYGGTLYTFLPLPEKELERTIWLRSNLLDTKGPNGEDLGPLERFTRSHLLESFERIYAWRRETKQRSALKSELVEEEADPF